MLRINNWNITTTEYFTPKVGEAFTESRKFITFDITDLNAAPYSYLWIDDASIKPNHIGNSLEVVAQFDDKNTASYFTILIDDGTNRAGVKISKNAVISLDSTKSYKVSNDDSNTHRYTLTLKEGYFTFSFDTDIVFEYQVDTPTVSPQLLVGFREAQNGAALLNIQYLKYTAGVYRYLKASDVDFELLIDTSSTFDSPNIKKFTKADFDHIPTVLGSWDPVSLMCGHLTEGAYDFRGIVQAVTVRMPPRQDQTAYNFYYKVRFTGDKYYSDFSRTYLVDRIKPRELAVIPDTVSLVSKTKAQLVKTGEYLINAPYSVDKDEDGIIICEIFDESNKGYNAVVPPMDNAVALLPEAPLSDGFYITIYNASDFNLRIYTTNPFEIATVAPWNVHTFVYNAFSNEWRNYIEKKVNTFILPPNITNTVFDAVYNYRIPAYDDVYTKSFGSGVVADITMGKAVAVDEFYKELCKQQNNLSSFAADSDDFNDRWRNVFNLDHSLFKNPAEMRDTFQVMLRNMNGELRKKALENIIGAITGVKPRITEYKDVIFNVLWSNKDLATLPDSKKYYLFDENNPSYTLNPFVLYGDSDQAFTFQIDVYDRYNLQYSQELISNIVSLFKPAYARAIVNYYSVEGVPYTKQYFYGIDNYNQAAYTK